MPMSARLLRPRATGFSPRSITGLALWLDASDASTLFQDAAATTPATATNDSVGAWLDKSGNARHATQSTAGSRPVVGSVNSRRAITFDGTDDFFTADIATTSLCSAAGGVAFYIAVPNNDSTWAAFTNSGVVGGIDRFPDNASYHGNFRATRFNSITSGAYSTTGAQLIVSRANASTGLQTIRKDGATIYSASENIAGYRGLSATASVNVGATVTGVGPPLVRSHFLAGSIPEILCYSSPLTDSQVARIERYLAARWGITLAPQVSNADAQDWINRVYANGGTVSSSTAAAVSTFCDAIDAASIRDRFYRLNLFCGGTSGTTAGLAACLVPLYRGPSLGGTQYGGTTDNNNNFAIGDYAETGASGGLKGNGTNKRLDTGLPGNTFATSSRHLSAYEIQVATTDYSPSLKQFTSPSTHWSLGPWAALNDYVYAGYSGVGGQPIALRQTGHFFGQNTSSTAAQIYRNGSPITSFNTGTAASSVDSTTIGVLGVSGEFSEARLGGYSIGLSMTNAQVAAYHTAMQAFQTALGRNV